MSNFTKAIKGLPTPLTSPDGDALVWRSQVLEVVAALPPGSDAYCRHCQWPGCSSRAHAHEDGRDCLFVFDVGDRFFLSACDEHDGGLLEGVVK